MSVKDTLIQVIRNGELELHPVNSKGMSDFIPLLACLEWFEFSFSRNLELKAYTVLLENDQPFWIVHSPSVPLCVENVDVWAAAGWARTDRNRELTVKRAKLFNYRVAERMAMVP